MEVKKAISQEEMRRSDHGRPTMRNYAPRDSYPRDPYGGGGGYRQYGGAYGGDYRSMQGGYDYSRYPSSDYMRGDAYMGGGGYGGVGGYVADRTAGYTAYPGYGRGYDMSAYGSSMYGAAGIGTYASQSTSGFGPSRDRDRGGVGGAPSRGAQHGFHPYRR